MGSVEAGVPGASHYLALAVDASGDGGEIARQSAEVREYTVLPKRAILGGVVGAADCANNLALIVNALGDRASSEVRELGGRAVSHDTASMVAPPQVPVSPTAWPLSLI